MNPQSFIVVGFEGHWSEDSPINWGVPALQKDEFVYNGGTGARSSLEKWNEYVEDEVVTKFSRSKPVSCDISDCPIILAIRKKASPIISKTLHTTNRVYRSWREDGGYEVFFFASKENYDVAVKLVIETVQANILETIENTLVLKHSSPVLLAARLTLKPDLDMSLARVMARAGLRSDEDRDKFDSIFR